MRAPTLLVILCTGISITACTQSSPQHQRTPAKPVGVRVGTVAREVVTEFLDLPGSIIRSRRAQLASPYGGVVTSTPVEAGSLVHRGQLLLIVGLADARSRLASAAARTTSARAAAQLAASDNSRFKVLLGDGAVAPREFERIHERYVAAMAALKAAKQALSAAENDLNYAEIRAPFDGLLEKRPVKTGDYVVPSRVVAVIVGGVPEIVLHVGTLAYRNLPLGTPLHVIISGQRYSAIVYQRINAANPVTRTYQVKLLLKAAGTGATPAFGDYAQVRVPIGKREATVVPYEALTKRAGLTGVFIVNAGHIAEFRMVQPGSGEERGMKVVASGLVAGEQVVLNPPLSLGNGSRVNATAGAQR